MAPKRQHLGDEDKLPHASMKRARTTDSDEESEAQARTTQTTRAGRERERKDKGKGKARADDSGTESSDGEIDIAAFDEAEVDDEEFERRHGDKLRARLERRKKGPGGVADHGIIEYIEMHQFMCHKFLKFKFGPQINFIIGHNGSGKSAVLSAITVALGGKANSTGRGNGIKAFIREGQSAAEVTIHIKNEGEEAFKPKEYGSPIIITRRFTKEGTSSWKIKSCDQKVISTKKDELAAICDHMNIQVDNPMNVLTQDAARQFLSASAPQDKYKFFLRGTQLTQLSDEYMACLENIHQTSKLLTVKKEALPDLRARLQEVNARYEEAAKAREQKKKADDLKKELAWSHVAAKEAEMEQAIQAAAKMARRIPKIQEEMDKAQAKYDETGQNVTALEAEVESLGDISELNTQRAELTNQLKANKNKISAYNSEMKQIDQSMQNIKGQIEEYDKRIEEEARRMAIHTQAKRDEIQHRLEEAKAAVTVPERQIHDIINERKELSVQLDTLRAEGDQKQGRKAEIERQITACDSMIDSARKAETDALVPYGRNIKQLLERMKSMRWHGEPPLGPLGQFVKAKDPKTWGEILRTMLGQYLMAFALTDARDRPQLKKMLMESGNPHTIIVIYEKDLFEYQHGEPPEHLNTVLRSLEISDPYVLRILINQAHIESQILANTRREAQDQLFKLRSGGSAWTLDKFSVRVFPEGGIQSSPLNVRPMGGPLSMLLTGRNSAAEIRHVSEQKAELEIQHRDLVREIEMIRTQYMKLRGTIEQLNNNEKQQQLCLRTAKTRLHQIQNEANEDLPVGVQGLEEAKQESVDEMENLKPQFEHVAREKLAVDRQQAHLQTQLNEVKKAIGEFDSQRAALTTRVNAEVEARLNAQNAMKHYKEKLEEERKKVEESEDAARIVEQEYKNWTATALKYCEQVPNPRKTAEVERLLESVQKALKDREKRHGASVEEMAAEVNKATENLEKVQKELRQMSILNKALKASLIVRLGRWQEFRRHIALRCKQVFQFHLSNRGYYGKILFDHANSTLQLRVQTDDQLQTQGTKDKDPRSLSGGEKSFSTICLLLSLWECIGCPLRCLDEFDVFMDAVNRRISMSMMIDTANTSDKKQYVLITPQDMGNVQLGATVKVHRMTDPERGSGLFAS